MTTTTHRARRTVGAVLSGVLLSAGLALAAPAATASSATTTSTTENLSCKDERRAVRDAREQAAYAKRVLEDRQEVLDVAKRRYERRPTARNAAAYERARDDRDNARGTYEDAVKRRKQAVRELRGCRNP